MLHIIFYKYNYLKSVIGAQENKISSLNIYTNVCQTSMFTPRKYNQGKKDTISFKIKKGGGESSWTQIIQKS